jgi:hypothetical protein
MGQVLTDLTLTLTLLIEADPDDLLILKNL